MRRSLRRSQSKGTILLPILFATLYVSTGASAQRGAQGPPTPGAQGRTAAAIHNMTPAQRLHAKLYKPAHGGRQILDSRESVTVYSEHMGDIDKSRSTTEILSDSVCSSDAVFVGQVVASTTLPTLDGTFLFTDYEVRVTNLIRVASQTPRPGFQVTVTRPGGVTAVNGVEVRATDTAWPLLEIGGTYLFFGSQIRETGAFQSRDSNVLRILDQKARTLAPLHDAPDLAWEKGLSEGSFTTLAKELSCKRLPLETSR